MSIDDQARRLGGRIRALRRSRGLTLVQLAEAAELSHPFISQLERGLARPSMGSLERLARALGSSQLELVAAGEDADDTPTAPHVPVVVRAHEGTRAPYGLGEGRLLVHGVTRFSPVEFVGSNTDPGDFFVHAEHEFVYVISGVVFVELEGSPTRVLRPGDSVYFQGGIGHRWGAAEPGEYRMFVVKERLVSR